jgi:hypothetical protein
MPGTPDPYAATATVEFGTDDPPGRVRELIVDGALFVVSGALVGLYLMAPGDHWTSQPVRLGDLTFGTLACLALWWRRHRPVAVAWVCVPLGVFVFSTGLVAALINNPDFPWTRRDLLIEGMLDMAVRGVVKMP